MKKPVCQLRCRALSRRAFLATASAGLASCALSDNRGMATNAWARAEQIVSTTTVPQFPDREFLVTDFGAATSSKDNSQAFARAISACHQAGGGRVRVPRGQFATGPIHLLSNVNFHLDEGCRLSFSTNPQDYLPAVFTRWEGMEMMGLSPLVYAYQQHNIALTGKGTLDGQANQNVWWPWKGGIWQSTSPWAAGGSGNQEKARAQLAQDVENNRPVAERYYAEAANLRPPFVQFYDCKNILISDVTITNSPFWLINPVLSKNVTVRGVTCASLGPNSDGCDPESCNNVVIENCFFDTGDDCVAIKSGRNADGRRLNKPAENIVIRNCTMRNGHGGIVIGSEISGGARNIFAENCTMNSPNLERGLRIKTNSVRGGVIEHIYLRNITIGQVQTAIVVDLNYEEGDSGNFTPQVRDIEVRNLTCANAKKLFEVAGYQRSPITNLHVIDSEFVQADEVGVLTNLKGFSAERVTIQGKHFSI